MTVVGPFLEDRLRFRPRLSVGLKAFQQQPECLRTASRPLDTISEAAAFWSLCVPAALRGVVSLHEILTAPIPAKPRAVEARCSFWTVTLTEWRQQNRREPCFTNDGLGGDRTPEAEVHPQTEARSWQTTVEFLREVLCLAPI
jgi:hypothetical protein